MSGNANAFRLALFTVVLYVAALATGLRLLYYLTYVMASLLVLAFIWSRLNTIGLRVKRQVEPSQLHTGQIVQETVEIDNDSWVRKLWLEVRDRSTLPAHRVGAVISLRGNRAKRWQVRTRCLKRGLYRLGPTVIMTGDPFGLFHYSRTFDQTNELLVFPPTVPLASFGIPATELPGGSQTERRSYHTTPNAAGIREYMPGDPMNRIHWPISARAQKLMVKEFELDPTTDIWLVLDLDEAVHAVADDDTGTNAAQPVRTALESPLRAPRPHTDGGRPTPTPEVTRLALEPSTEEYAVTVTASLAAYLLSLGRSVGLIAWGQHKVVLPVDRGGRQLIKILRALAVLRAEGTSSLGELLASETRQFGRQDTVVIVTPSVSEEWIEPLRHHLYKGMRAAAVIVEPGTFGGEGNPLMVVSELSAVDVPTYMVKRDDSIDAALGQHYGPGAVRHLR